MKLGVSYNVFDGVELLPSSIAAIRNEVDCISVVLQRVSNAGIKCDEETIDAVYELKKNALVDIIYEYDTDLGKTRHENEKAKRDIGLELSRESGCSHFMSMDVDEYYDIDQLHKVKKHIIRKDISATAVSIVEYLKHPCNQMVNGYTFSGKNNEFYNFYCPFIFKIDSSIVQKHGYSDFPCLADPTRSLPFHGKFYLFSKQDIVMHHMSTIRKNLYEKYTNSSLVNDSTNNRLVELQDDIIHFDFEKNKMNDEYSLFRDTIIKKVDNRFDVPADFNVDAVQNYAALKLARRKKTKFGALGSKIQMKMKKLWSH